MARCRPRRLAGRSSRVRRVPGRARAGLHHSPGSLGQGLATEVATALVGWHRQFADHVPLWAYVSPGNHACTRVLDKVGFRRPGAVECRGEVCPPFRLPAGAEPGASLG
ncbi:GNAT family N-acetyltransferase [Nostocoides australiense]|uniref:GNAT family N-acetyltransferase n=1 Tax=Nostocoides australiense TaxID=99480 RepID=UPI003899211D